MSSIEGWCLMNRLCATASRLAAVAAFAGLAASVGAATSPVAAQTGPTVVDPDLSVRTVVSGLVTPSTMAFLSPNDFLVLEKNTGNVKRVVDGTAQGVVLDLAVNSASERGLLGIALHPDFPDDPGVYLYWSCAAPPPDASNPFIPRRERCAETPEAELTARTFWPSRCSETASTVSSGRARRWCSTTICSCCGRSSTTARPSPRSERQCSAGAREPRRRRHRVRGRREAVRPGRRPGAPRPDAESPAGADASDG